MRMILSLLMVVVLLSSGSPAAAQSLQISVEAGAGHSFFSYGRLLPFWCLSGKASYNAAVKARWKLSKSLVLQSGIRFSRVENELTVHITTERDFLRGVSSFSHSYLSIPLQLEVTPFKTGTYFFLGPEMGYIVAASLVSDNVIESITSQNLIDQIERPALFVSGGIGQEISVRNQTLRLQFTYSHVLTRTAKRDLWYSDWKPRDVAFSLGYIL